MIRKALTVLFVTALAACGQAADEPQAAAEGREPAAAITAAPEIAGEYRVAGVDGSDIDLPHGVTASITADRIHLVSDCVNLAWTYRFQGETLVTETAPAESCARGFDATEQALLAAFDVADTVRRTPANALEFSGGGHSVTLFSQ